MDALKSLIQPLVGGAGASSVVDGMKLVVLGGTVETARRVSSSAWSHFVNSFFLTAHFSEEDYPYDWLMLWLSRRPEWQRSREFETTTRTSSFGMSGNNDNSFGDDEDYDEDCPGRVKTRVVFQPTFDTTHTIYYRGHWLRVKRSRKSDGIEVLSISFLVPFFLLFFFFFFSTLPPPPSLRNTNTASLVSLPPPRLLKSVVARSNTILKQLVLQAKREYEAEAVHRIQIYFADSHGSWRWTDSRHKRPMSSIVLNPGVKEMLLTDTKDFLKSEKWYADRGIPFRRGYLLHGVPGSGKSSLIHAIAGELMLDIYVVSLSASWISDATLNTLMGRVPARCILLLEDLDAAFTRSTNRDGSGKDDRDDKDKDGGNGGSGSSSTVATSGSVNGSSSGARRRGRSSDQLSDVNTLSLSGLLNALDGVAAAEGRILFATTNHLERLDPALSRPGRMDVWVEFKNASKWQAEALFRNFFPSVEDEREQHGVLSPLDEEEALLLEREMMAAESRGKSATNGRNSDVGGGVMSSSPTSPSSSGETGIGSTGSSRSSLWSSFSPFSTRSASSTSLSGSMGEDQQEGGGGEGRGRTASVSESGDGNGKRHGEKNGMQQQHQHQQAYEPPPVEDHILASQHSAKPLDAETLSRLAKQFADGVPDEEFSVAALQGYLLRNKSQPEAAADGIVAWVKSEREMRDRLKREKEAREAKEKQERDKRRKEASAKESEKKELEKKDQELEKLRQQLADKEKADGGVKGGNEVKQEGGESVCAAQPAAVAAVVVEGEDADGDEEEGDENVDPAVAATGKSTAAVVVVMEEEDAKSEVSWRSESELINDWGVPVFPPPPPPPLPLGNGGQPFLPPLVLPAHVPMQLIPPQRK
ncbi:hypothetical protein AMATHDRAFT_51616 [Amanita thiersii Skay4041]|uniref:AAA+ ATPase domain-containing protein n=1 Tax=Amanita thiersii Skay4041 TaxID=703135 RepID=A0A2A9ND23_9AGAR|nr:hypothetical protein AMATHDRAFT_51616 [Amanita thiersii Skay4041]